MRGGERVPFTAAALSDLLRAENVDIVVQLRAGSACAEAWTCDLSYEYVKINAEYHT